MAKLRAHGRQEIFRVSRETSIDPPDKFGIFWRKHSIAVMSDGYVLERDAWKAQDRYSQSGVRHEGGTWKVRGKIKPGLTVGDILEIYKKKGYVFESGRANGEVLRTEKEAAGEKARKAKAATKRAQVAAEKSGPGFYVRNRTTTATPWAVNHGPFKTLDEAIEKAWRAYQEYLEMGFDYLLPVQIVEAKSKYAAGYDLDTHVWWTNGRSKGPPADPRQLRFPGINGGV
jgi:hypothetical protein